MNCCRENPSDTTQDTRTLPATPETFYSPFPSTSYRDEAADTQGLMLFWKNALLVFFNPQLFSSSFFFW